MQQTDFDAAGTLVHIKEERLVRRHRCTWGKSRLVKYRSELIKLKNEGASLGDLVYWLASEKRIRVAKTTVMRFLQKLPELNQDRTNA